MDPLPYNIRHDEIPTETHLQSEIAALKYKNERLTQELRDNENRMKSKETSLIRQNNEIDTLKENLARSTAINSSLQRKLQDVEERERQLSLTNQRQEDDMCRIKQEVQHSQSVNEDLQSQLRSVLIDRDGADQAKEHSQRTLTEFCKKLGNAIDLQEESPKMEAILKRVYELFQENRRLNVKVVEMRQSIECFERENKLNAEMIGRLHSEKEGANQRIVSFMSNVDALKREKDEIQTQKSYLQTELTSYKERSCITDRTVSNLNEQAKGLEQQFQTLKQNLLISEEKNSRIEKELRNFQDSVAIQLSSGSRTVETPSGIRERIREIQNELKEKLYANDQLKEKVGRLSENIERLEKLLSDAKGKQEDAISDKVISAKKLQETETQLTTAEILNEGLRRDKNRYMQFLEQLGNILGLDEVSKELGFDLQTDAIVTRAGQLAKLEGDRLADKTASVYQLQRRLKTLKEQMEKKDLHLDMLRKKITLLEDSIKLRTTLELERDEATSRCRKLIKQVERLELDLREAKLSVKDVKMHLADATEYKIISLERARKIEELETKLNDMEVLRVKYNRKVNLLKDQLKISRENTNQERDLNDNAFQRLSSELNACRKNLMEATRRENQLLNLRSTLGKILGIDWSKTIVPDYELIAKLEKVVQANREFAQVSRKLSENIKEIPHDLGDDAESGEGDFGRPVELLRRNV